MARYRAVLSVNPPVASTEVEEERAEASIVDVWRINPQLTLESGFNYEASTIRQTITQPAQPDIERDFTYPKPRIVATWTPSATDQVRLSLVRDVSQLDFGDFATGLNSISSTANVGNTNLEPEQTWKLSAQWKRQIGQRGSISHHRLLRRHRGHAGFHLAGLRADADRHEPLAMSATASDGAAASRRRCRWTAWASRTAC